MSETIESRLAKVEPFQTVQLDEPIDMSGDCMWSIILTAPDTAQNFDFGLWIHGLEQWLGADQGVGIRRSMKVYLHSLGGQRARGGVARSLCLDLGKSLAQGDAGSGPRVVKRSDAQERE